MAKHNRDIQTCEPSAYSFPYPSLKVPKIINTTALLSLGFGKNVCVYIWSAEYCYQECPFWVPTGAFNETYVFK